MIITTKRKADSLIVDSLFKPGGTCFTEKYDNGKYAGKPSDFIGKEVRDLTGVIAIYPVSRKNKDGKYVQLMCITKTGA